MQKEASGKSLAECPDAVVGGVPELAAELLYRDLLAGGAVDVSVVAIASDVAF